MITLLTALYEEAKPYIEYFQAKKDPKETICQKFVSDRATILVSGCGTLAACAAVVRQFTKCPPKRSDILANVGIAAAVRGSGPEDVRGPSKIGQTYLAVKLTEAAAGRTFFPDLLYENDFPRAQLVTSPRAICYENREGCPAWLREVLSNDGSGAMTEPAQNILIDMEAAGVYQAALPYLSPERMFFIKTVSDHADADRTVDPYQLIQPAAEKVCAFLEKVDRILKKEETPMPEVSEEEDALIKELYQRLSLTVAVRQEIERLFGYCRMSGMQVARPLGEFLSQLPDEIHGKKNCMPYLKKLRKLLLEQKEVPERSETEEERREGYRPFFSNVYVEEKTLGDPFFLNCADCLQEEKTWIPIRHYKDVFNRSHQDFARQKKSPAFIFAKNEGALIYPGAPVCQNFGNEHFYYTSNIMNCVYHCEYCYLQGMYPSGNLVVFVNLEDTFAALDVLLDKHPVYLCVSYDTDILALESMFHFASRWISYAARKENLTVEIRTKSGNPKLFQTLADGYSTQVLERIIFAWTLSPENVALRYEKSAAPISQRLLAARAAKDAGFTVRFCFDPMIFTPNWKKDYRCLIASVFYDFPPALLYDVSVGVFRISSTYLKQMRKNRKDSAIAQFPYVSENGVSHYGELSDEMMEFIREELLRYLPEEKIFIWENDSV